MKFKPFEDYSKPADISDEKRMELIYSAIKELNDTHCHCRMGDVVEYLNNKHPNIEFDMVSTAKHVFLMKREIVWTCEKIEGVLCPVCYPLRRELAVYKRYWLAKP